MRSAVASNVPSPVAASIGTAGRVPSSTIPQRIVVMSWELAEMLLSLDVVPVGLSLPDWYRKTIVVPPLPNSVANIGLLYQPNFEMLWTLRPDLIVITTGHTPAKHWLERIAPTITLGMYRRAADPYDALCGETALLAKRLGRAEKGTALIAEAAKTIGEVRTMMALQPARLPRPVIVAEMVDDRHLRVYGRGSLFDQMLGRIGIENAVHPSNGRDVWATEGGYTMIPVQRLADVSEASLLIVGAVPPETQNALARNVIWQSLPAIREKRVMTLPMIAAYGGLVSMQRFVRAVDTALTKIEMGDGGVA